MKSFFFFFYLLYWYSYIVYPEYFVCRGGGDSFLFIFLKTIKKQNKKHPRSESNPGFQPVVLVFLFSIPGVFCLSGRGDSFLFIF